MPALLVLLSISSGCHRAPTPTGAAAGKRATPATRALRFGRGGGFAGMVTTYTLRSDGRLERRAGTPADTAAVQLAAPPAPVVAECFKALDALPTDSLRLHTLGNHYYFLEGQTSAGHDVALMWGAGRTSVPRAARELHRRLMTLVAGK